MYSDQLLDFQNIAFIIPSNFNNMADAVLFFNTIRVSNSSGPDQARHFVGPGLGPNCLQSLSADSKSHG